MKYINVVCSGCKKIIPFVDPNFCCFCGEKVSEESKAKASPVTEQELQEYRCRQRSW